MARNPLDLLRKLPRQRRAQTTAAAIVEAAAQVFEECGLERATTNRIAEVAGVSIGTLYQYYPNKESLIAALFERESEFYAREFMGAVERNGLNDIQRMLEDFLERMLSGFDARRKLYRVLFDELPAIAGLEPSHRIDLRIAQAVQLLFEMSSDRLDVGDRALAAELVVRAVRYNTIVHVREPFVGERRKAVVAELAAMVTRYLFGKRGLDKISGS